MASRRPEVVKPSSRKNIFKHFQILYRFSTSFSQMEVLTTSKNGFQKTGSSYNFVANQHFRNTSNSIRVFDYCHSNESVYDLQKWLPEDLKWLNLRPETTFSNIFEYYTGFRLVSVKWKCLRITTSRNGFQKIESSYPESTFLNTIRVFDYFQSNGSVIDFQKWFSENRKQF